MKGTELILDIWMLSVYATLLPASNKVITTHNQVSNALQGAGTFT